MDQQESFHPREMIVGRERLETLLTQCNFISDELDRISQDTDAFNSKRKHSYADLTLKEDNDAQLRTFNGYIFELMEQLQKNLTAMEFTRRTTPRLDEGKNAAKRLKDEIIKLLNVLERAEQLDTDTVDLVDVYESIYGVSEQFTMKSPSQLSNAIANVHDRVHEFAELHGVETAAELGYAVETEAEIVEDPKPPRMNIKTQPQNLPFSDQPYQGA